MTEPEGFGAAIDFDAFSVAVVSAVICGVLSTFIPWLIAPTATLSALALAGWVSLARRRGTLSWRDLRNGSAVALGLLGAAAAGFIDPPASIASVRGIVLVAGLVPLFALDRIRFGQHCPSFSEA